MTAGETLSPSQFIAALRSGNVEAIERKYVEGAVNLRGVTIEAPVRALYTHFEGHVDLSDCVFESDVDLSGCTFSRALSLRNSSIDGDLVLDDVQVRYLPSLWGARMPDTYALDLHGAVVTGDLFLERSQVAGCVNGGGMEVGGNLSILGTEIDLGLILRNISVGANFAFGVWVSPRANDADPYHRPCKVIGTVAAENMKIGGVVNLMGVQILGSAFFWGGTFGSSIFSMPYWALVETKRGGTDIQERAILYRTYVRDDLSFAASKINGHLELKSITVGGALLLHSIEGSTIRLSPYKEAAAPYGGPCSVGLLVLSNVTLTGHMDLSQIQITGVKSESEQRGAWLQNIFVAGDVSLWTPTPIKEESQAPDALSTEPLHDCAVVNGDFDASNASISGELLLTNLTVSGSLLLKDAHVRGDITFHSAATLHRGRKPTLKASLGVGVRPLRARATTLDLSATRCDNDVDLTGLDLVADGHETIGDAPPGSIKAERLVAEGAIQLYARHEGSKIEDCTEVPGAIDFSDARASQFVISSHSFQNEAAIESDIDKVGIRLAGAEIGEFKVIGVPDKRRGIWRSIKRLLHVSLLGSRHELFPVPVDLRDVSVKVWSVGGDRRPRVDEFAALLRCDPVFRRDTYVRVEEMLRNGGHIEEADTLYKSMKRQERLQRWRDATAWHWPQVEIANPLARAAYRSILFAVNVITLAYRWLWLSIGQVFLYAPYRWLMGFGTAPLRLLAVIAGIWILSLPVYFERLNYEPSLAYREAANIAPETARNLTPDAEAWSGGTPLFTSVAVHIPVVGLAVRREWRLRTYGETCWNWDSLSGGGPRDSCTKTLPIVPEDYGLLMAILNWALWPLVLTFMIRRLLRQ